MAGRRFWAESMSPIPPLGPWGVPFLAKIPLLGFLFRKDTKSEKNTELLIFITPRVLRQ
ncbi:hypothetical protein [Geothrix sp. 21YS21S-4]|uniref:hypothetical protein n=1 Tax=Geothrix sp. 21YS21S-4 TaxID=3068889 RepID=UPI003593CB56